MYIVEPGTVCCERCFQYHGCYYMCCYISGNCNWTAGICQKCEENGCLYEQIVAISTCQVGSESSVIGIFCRFKLYLFYNNGKYKLKQLFIDFSCWHRRHCGVSVITFWRETGAPREDSPVHPGNHIPSNVQTLRLQPGSPCWVIRALTTETVGQLQLYSSVP